MSQPVDLIVGHNIEVAHRLLNLPGKCQNIHGHSMWVQLTIKAIDSDENGYATSAKGDVLEFGRIKQDFRGYLDKYWDHHLHLNDMDPWARQLGINHNAQGRKIQQAQLPGLQVWPGDPSTENIARWIHTAMQVFLPIETLSVRVSETRTNGVEVCRS